MINQEFTAEEARTIGEQIGIDWEQIPIEEFRRGLAVELERSGMRSDDTIVTAEDLLAAGKVAEEYLKATPDYYTSLEHTETEGGAKKKEYSVNGKELKDKVKQVINEGKAKRIIIKNKQDETIVEIPIVVGVIGAVMAPALAAVGAAAALLTDCKLVVIEK